MRHFIWASALTLAVTLAARGEAPSTQLPPTTTQPDKAWHNPNPARYLFEDQIKPGMKGHGLTVMRGNKIEKFEFEVIDVVRGFAPGHNAILVRCSGLNLEHSGIIAGMSGSPVYIDGKMIGAIAFGWGLNKDPIAGIQPIRQMLNIPIQENAKPEATARGMSLETLKLTQESPMWRAIGKNLAKRSGISLDEKKVEPAAAKPGLTRLVTPLMVAGASEDFVKQLQTTFAATNFVPVAAGNASDMSGRPLGGAAALAKDAIKLEPGSAIAVPIVTGDLDLSAIGTVTEVVDKKVYAFGHQFFADGNVELPMHTGYIYTIMPNLMQSFKLGASFSPQGTLRVDETTGIVGIVGDRPKLTPFKLAVGSTDGAINKTYNYEIAAHPRLTPFILNGIFGASLMGQRTLPKNFTIAIDGEAEFGNRKIKLNGKGTNNSLGGVNVIMPVAMLLDNPFENLKLTNLKLEAKIEPVNRNMQIKHVVIDRTTVAPGDEIVARVTVERFQQKPEDLLIKLKVPADTPEGSYDLQVGGASSVMFADQMAAPHRYDPKDVDALIQMMERVMSFDESKLYARLTLDLRGASKDGREVKNLPNSRIALFASPKRGDTAPVTAYIETTLNTDGVFSYGGDSFNITIDRRANQLYRHAEPGMGRGIGPVPNRSRGIREDQISPSRRGPHDEPMPPGDDH